MATTFLSTANTFLPSSSSSSSSLAATHIYPHRHNVKRQLTLSKAVSEPRPSSPIITKRSLSITLLTSLVFSLAGKGYYSDANAAILEADDDEELLEKVKKDRKKRIEKQGVISSSNKETGWLPSVCFFYCVFFYSENPISPADPIVKRCACWQWILFVPIQSMGFSLVVMNCFKLEIEGNVAFAFRQ